MGAFHPFETERSFLIKHMFHSKEHGWISGVQPKFKLIEKNEMMKGIFMRSHRW